MTMSWPKVMPALVTAMTDTGEIDRRSHDHNVSAAVEAGASGILIAGSTGEGPYLDPGERAMLVAAARALSSDTTILCGVFAESHRQGSAQIAEAAEAGADAVLVVTPTTLIRDRREPILAYYEHIADTSPLPVFLYTVPRTTGYELPCDMVAELAGHPNIAGMKDSGGESARLDDIRSILSKDFVVYAGASRALADSAARGAHGAITASANYAYAWVAAAVERDHEAQAALTEVTAVVERYGVPGTKYAASLSGLRPGYGRAPLPRLDASAEYAVSTALQRLSG